MENFGDGGFQQLIPRQQNQLPEQHGGQVFHPAVAEGVLRIGRGLGQHKPEQRHHGGGGIRQVIEGVRDDGQAAGQQTGGELQRKQQCVCDNPRDTGELAVGTAHGGILRLFVIADPFADQKTGHACRSSPGQHIRPAVLCLMLQAAAPPSRAGDRPAVRPPRRIGPWRSYRP